MGIHALAQDTLRRNTLQPQRLGEVGILPEPVDGLEIALAQTQLRDRAGENVGMTHRVAAQGGYPLRIRGQVGVFIQRQANESKPRMGGQIHLEFRDDKPPHPITYQVTPKMPIILIISYCLYGKNMSF